MQDLIRELLVARLALVKKSRVMTTATGSKTPGNKIGERIADIDAQLSELGVKAVAL